MAENDETDVIARLPRLDELSLAQVQMVDRTVLAAVLLDELDGADDKAARFQSIL